MTVIHRFLAVDYSTVVYALFNGFLKILFPRFIVKYRYKETLARIVFSTIVEPHSYLSRIGFSLSNRLCRFWFVLLIICIEIK